MPKTAKAELSRRERQIMDILYQQGRATAADVHQRLPNQPSYSAVRAMLRILEEKGHLRHEQDGPRYIFLPTMPRETARRHALKHLLQTFFEGSTERAISALLDASSSKLSNEEFNRLARLIENARKEGKG